MDTHKRRLDVISAEESFEVFYRREYSGQLRRAVLLVGSEADAADAVAHAFTTIYSRWEELDQPGAYLNRSVLNACRDIGRRRTKLTVVEDPTHGDEHHDRYRSDAILDHLGRLPYNQRAVVVLKHYVGLSEKEIAAQLDIAQGSVGPTLYRAHTKLKTTLRELAP